MHTNLQEVYSWTLRKYRKYRIRLKRNLKNGRFYELSERKQQEVLSRIERLKKRLSQLKLQLKVAAATGIISATLSVSSSQAQQLGPFVENEDKNPLRSTSVTGADKNLTFADVDNDGDFDFVMGLYDGSTVYYENIGDEINPRFVERTGTSNPFDGISIGSQLAAPELIDFDGDGDYDLLIGEYASFPSAVSFYVNNDFENDGVIGNDPDFNLVANPGSPIDDVDVAKYNVKPTLVDIDGDGDLDIVIGRNGGFPDYESLIYFENNAGFSQQPLFAGLGEFAFDTSSQLNAPTFNDIDGDGDFDLLIGTSGGNIRLFLNTDIDPSDPGDTTIGDDIAFTEQFSIDNPFDGVNEGPHSVISFVDLDDDGDDDAVIGQQNVSRAPAFYRNTPSGFVSETGLNNPFDNFDVGFDASPTFVDIDGDGDLDAVIGAKYGNDIYLVENNNGIFTDLTGTGTPLDNLAGLPASGNAAASPEFVLADSDSDFDLFVGLYYDPTHFYYRNVGTPTNPNFSNQGGRFNLPISSGSDSSPTFGDLTGDGIEDAIVGFDSQGQMRFFMGTTEEPAFSNEITGAASPVDGISVGTVGNPRYAKPNLVDLDHDGDLDLAVGIHGYSAEVYDGRVVYFRNNGSASFEQLISTANPFDGIIAAQTGGETGDSEPTFADIDEDGDLDMFVGNANGQVQHFENQNIAPTVSLSTTSISYSENDGPVLLDPSLQLSDDTNDDIIKAEIIITDNYLQGIDILSFTSQFGITGTFDVANGLLRLEGAATLGQYETALRSVTYENTSEDPQILTRTVELYVTDFDATDPQLGGLPVAALTIDITPINDPPILMSNGSRVTFTEGGDPVIVNEIIQVVDVDSPDMTGAVITINEGFASGQDWLDFTDQNGISGNYNTISGTLTLSGTANVSDYGNALRSITFRNTSSAPSTQERSVSFRVNDGEFFSNIESAFVEVVPVNTMPFLSSDNNSDIDYTQNGMPVAVDNDLSTFDNDDIELESLQVSILGFVAGDVLDINEPTGTTKNFDTQTGILTVSGTAIIAAYSSALSSTTFSSTNGAGTRDIEFIVNDGELDSSPFTRSINLFDEGNNEPPAVEPAPRSTQVGSIITINLEDIISDPDNDFAELDISVLSTASGASTSISGGVLTIDYTGLSFEGIDDIVLEACDPFGACDQNSVEVTVEPNTGEIEIFNAVSPNGDGANEFFEIANITTPNTVEIYNRWGDLVYEVSDYNNSTVRFEGNSNQGSSGDLAAGTYFYSIKTADQTITGYLVLKK